MLKKIFLSVALGVIAIMLIGIGWRYVYVPRKEMANILPLKEKMVHLYEDNDMFPSPPGKPENVRKYMEISVNMTKIKRELNKESVSLRTEKAQKATALLITTATKFEKFCNVSADIERGLLPENGNKPANKKFEKNLDDFYVLQSELEDKYFPQLDGYFSK